MSMAGDKYKLGPHKEKRLARVSIVVPFCVGSYAMHLGKKAVENASHQWVVYVRAPDNTDLSHVIAKVSFTLHNSFEQPLREVLQSPFEVRERGWGEFDVQIKIDFKPEAMEAPIKLTHRLKLYEDGVDVSKSNPKKPVIREVYDELVFWEPTEAFFNIVKSVPRARPAKPSEEPNLEQQLPVYKEQADLNMMLAARNRLAQERATLTAQLDQPV